MARIAIVLLMVLFGAVDSPARTDTLTILHLGDTHSCLMPLAPRTPSLEGTRGGIARAASLIATERKRDRDLLLVHAGDLFVGDPMFNRFFGVPELRLLAHLGLNAIALGNHEFDLTPVVLLQALDSAFATTPVPVLSANLNLSDASLAGLRRWVFPFTVQKAHGVPVGIFGMTTPSANMLSQPAPARLDTDVIGAASHAVAELKRRGCRVIVCLSHLGKDVDMQLAARVHGITAVIGGHDHQRLTRPRLVNGSAGESTWVMQGDPFYRSVGRLRLVVTGERVSLADYALIPVDRTIVPDPEVQAAVAALAREVEETLGPFYSEQLAVAERTIADASGSYALPGKHDTPAGNLVADAFRQATGTDVAFEAVGSVAAPLCHGPVTGADVFRMVGYGFNTVNGLGYRIATFTLLGKVIMGMVQQGLDAVPSTTDYVLQVSGMSYAYGLRPQDRGLQLVRVLIGRTPIDPDREYSVTANEYAVMIMSAAGIPLKDLHVEQARTEFQVVSAYVKEKQTLKPAVEGRVRNIGPLRGSR